MIMGDFNIDVNSNMSSTLDYLHMLQSNSCINLITKPTQVTSSTQTIIDHILTNDNESNITPGIFDYVVSDHSSICKIFRSKLQTQNIEGKFTFRNTKHADGNQSRNDSENNVIPITNEFSSSCITRKNFDLHFDKLLRAISDISDKQASLQPAFKKQKRIQLKPWLTKNLLVFTKKKNNASYTALASLLEMILTNFFRKFMLLH